MAKAKAKAKVKKSAPEEDEGVEYVFDEEIHPAGEKPRQVKLTEADLDPRNDPHLRPLFDFIDNPELANYFQMPSLRGLKNYVKSVEKVITQDFQNYKKRGRI